MVDITQTLNIGIGKFGNILVDDIMSKDSRCQGFMIDASEINIFSLDNFSRCGITLIPYLGETKELMSFNTLADEFYRKYSDYNVFVLYFSMGEEFGSNYIESVAKVIRDLMPHSKIISVGAIPNNYATARIRTGNVEKSFNKLRKLENGVIDKFILIDNYKRNTSSDVIEDNTSMLISAIEDMQKTLEEV